MSNATAVPPSLGRLIPRVPPPRPPETLAESGLTVDLVAQLVLKTLFFAGELTGSELARRLGVSFAIVEPATTFLKAQSHLQIVGGAITGGASFQYRLTPEGRSIAAMYLQQNHYVGSAPVPLEQYRSYLSRFARAARAQVLREDVRAAFPNLILSETVVDEIGPAINRAHSVFIYGPPGNGKTAIARGLHSLFPGDIAIPYAIEVEGAIIRVFDPVTHEARPAGSDQGGIMSTAPMDRRWITCRRPMLQAGGEMTLEALDLSYAAGQGFYRAPLQMLANGGVLLIDDFGRQRLTPQDLLNRWMVPLESGVDFLTLQSGQRFEVPFHVFVAFSTNLLAADLVDEAFLRRVPFKVRAENPSRPQFLKIFELCCNNERVTYSPALVEHLLDTYFEPRKLPLRGCYPRDLITQALLVAEYDGLPRELTPELLDKACEGYFVEDTR